VTVLVGCIIFGIFVLSKTNFNKAI